MCRRWVWAVCGEMNSFSAICLSVLPSAASRATAASVSVNDSNPVLGRSIADGRRRTPKRRNRARIRAESQLAPTLVVTISALSNASIAPGYLHFESASCQRPQEPMQRREGAGPLL